MNGPERQPVRESFGFSRITDSKCEEYESSLKFEPPRFIINFRFLLILFLPSIFKALTTHEKYW